MSYAGEKGENCEFKAIVSIGNPFELEKCAQTIEKWHKFIYHQNILRGFKKNYYNNKEQLIKNKNIDPEKVENSKTIEEFDANLTIKLHNYPTTHEYYQNASCKKCIKDIKIPVLCIHSADDPIVENCIVPYEDLKANKNIILVQSNRGGHIDWFTTRFARRWVFWPSIEFLLTIERLRQLEKDNKGPQTNIDRINAPTSQTVPAKQPLAKT